MLNFTYFHQKVAKGTRKLAFLALSIPKQTKFEAFFGWRIIFLAFLHYKFEKSIQFNFYTYHLCVSVTSNSSLSFEAKELKFDYRLLILMPKKLPTRFLKFCLRAEI